MFGTKMDKIKKAVKNSNVKTLIELANSKDMHIKLAAIDGIGKVGGDDASNYLVMQLRNIDAQIRVAAATALGETGDIHSRAHISGQLTRETDPHIRDAMSKAVMKIGSY